MGAYVYRLKGPKAFDVMNIEGNEEKVYHLVFWYKPYLSVFNPEPRWMKGIRAFQGRLKSLFKDIEVKYAMSVFVKDDGTILRSDHILRWNPRWTCVTDEPNWGNLKRIKVEPENIISLIDKHT